MKDRSALVNYLLLSFAFVYLYGGALDLYVKHVTGVEHLRLYSYANGWLAATVLLGLLLSVDARPRLPLGRVETVLLVAIAIHAVAITAIRAPLPKHGLNELSNLGLLLILTAVAASAMRHAPEQRIMGVATAIMLSGVLSIPVILATEQWFGIVEGNFYIRLPGVGGTRVYGDALVAAAMATTGLLALASSRRRILVLAVLLTILLTTLFWSGSRGGFLSVVATLSIGAAISAPLRARLPVLLACIFGGAALSTLFVTPHNSFNLVANLWESYDLALAGEDISSNRLVIWREAMSLILAKPLLGYGWMQAFALIDGTGQQIVHLHNSLLELAMGIGIPAAVVVTALTLRFWLRGSALAARDPMALPGFLVVTSQLGLSLVSGTYTHMEAAVPIALGAAMLMTLARRDSL